MNSTLELVAKININAGASVSFSFHIEVEGRALSASQKLGTLATEHVPPIHFNSANKVG